MFHILEKRLAIALSVTATIAILAYIFSFQAGVRNSALLAAVAIAAVWFAIRRPAWVMVKRVNTLGHTQTPILAISHADNERYPSLVESLHKAEEAYVSRIHKNEAYSILSFLRNQNANSSSREFYVEFEGKVFHSRLYFQREKPKLDQ